MKYRSKILSNSPGTTCDLNPIPSAVVMLYCRNSIFSQSYANPTYAEEGQLGLIHVANYRPIPNLGFLGKTLERVVAKQLSTFLANNNFIDAFQSAYRAHHSVETALLNVHNDLLQAMNCGKITLNQIK